MPKTSYITATNAGDALKCHELVANFFQGDTKKAQAWFTTPNPLLGDVAPRDLINLGRAQKLLQFIQTQIDANESP